jgi:PAS domain S-box-containing protein
MNSLDFKNIFDTSQGAVLVILPDDPKFTIVAANQAFEKQTLTKREEIIGRSVFEVFPDTQNGPNETEVRKTHASYLRVIKNRTTDTIAIIKYNIQNQEIEGGKFKERYWNVVNSPVFNAEGSLTYIVVQPEDVTEFMRLKLCRVEQEILMAELQSATARMQSEIFLTSKLYLEQTTLMAELRAEAARMQSEIFLASKLYVDSQRAIKEREYILSVVSNELKNPLSAIKSATQILSKNNLYTDEILLVARNILQSTQTIERLILDLLDFGKIQSGTLLLKKDSESVAELIKAAMDSVAPLALEKKIKLISELPAKDLRICGDRNRIIQVLSSLIENAIKFTLEMGEVQIKASKFGEDVQFSVIDTGPSIAVEKIPKLFDQFWQTKELGDLGTGLRLSIVKGIIESHGGKIWVEGPTGQGNQFNFTIKVINHTWKAPMMDLEV